MKLLQVNWIETYNNSFDDLNCFYFALSFAGIIVYIFDHGNSNKLILRADVITGFLLRRYGFIFFGQPLTQKRHTIFLNICE